MTLKTSPVPSLNFYDYAILSSTLIFSTVIGIYYGCFGAKQNTTKQYLFGGNKMKIIPVGVSVAISHISGTLLLGTVADVYWYGGSVWLMIFAYSLMGVLSVCVFLPVFYKLQVSNIYDYLERRFDKRAKTMAFVLYIVLEIFHFPVLAYTPSLTFATASGIQPHLSAWPAFIICCICVFYTSIGGLKTVVWTDFLQFGVIMSSLVIIYTVGLNNSGGFVSVWNTALDGDRLRIFNFTADVTARDSFWVYLLGLGATFTSLIVHQPATQKLLSLPKQEDAAWSVFYVVVSMSLIHTFGVFIGLVVYAKYKDCDPLTSHMVTKHDQLFPYFVADIAAGLPGISGLFIAAICSAALSSMSSNLNALSGLIYKDVICPHLKQEPSEERGILILKMTSLILGLLCSCLVFLVDRMGEIFSISSLFWGVTQGPILGAFTLGILFPKANNKGAFYGMLGGFILVACLALPTKYYQMNGLLKDPVKPLSTSGCDFLNESLNSTNLVGLNGSSLGHQVPFQPPTIFKTSFFYYTFIGAGITIVLGLIISYLTKRNSTVDRNLLSPIIYTCLSKKTKSSDGASYCSVEEALDMLHQSK